MPAFPDGTIVNLPASLGLDGSFGVIVRWEPGADADRLRKVYGPRLLGFEAESGRLGGPEALGALAGEPVLVRLGDRRHIEDGELLDAFRRLRLAFLVRPDEELFRTANFLTSLGYPVRIDLTAAVGSMEVLLRTLDFYLHNPVLSRPIEPFHSLLAAISSASMRTLWEIEAEDPRLNFYVGSGGRISLSRRWSEGGRHFGTLDDPWLDIIGSDLYLALGSWKARIFKERSPCAFCAHFDICAGFLRAVDAVWPCESWQRAFDILREEVGKARGLLGGRPADPPAP